MFRKILNFLFGTKSTGIVNPIEVKFLQTGPNGIPEERTLKLHPNSDIEEQKLTWEKNIPGFIQWITKETPIEYKNEVPTPYLKKPYSISKNGIDLIQKWESLELTSYLDTGGVWTIGWGHTAGVKQGMTITKEKADQLFYSYIEQQTKELNEILKNVNLLNQNQFDAISSFVYNIGSSRFSNSTFLQLLKNGKFDKAANQLVRRDSNGVYHGWIYDNGRKIKGLINRRKEEKALFLRSN